MLSGLLPVVSVPDSMTSAALWMLLLISAAGSLPVVSITTGGGGGGTTSSHGCTITIGKDNALTGCTWPHEDIEAA